MSYARVGLAPKVDAMIDHRQKYILRSFAKYLEIRRIKMSTAHRSASEINYNLGFGAEYNLCSGLVAYWLASMRINKERQFIKQIEYACNWDAQNFLESVAVEDSYLEGLLNIVSFFQSDLKRRAGNSFATTVNIIFPDYQRQPLREEFAITFVFIVKKLTTFIQDYCSENKMLRIDNGFHVVGCMKNASGYAFYDPDAKQGPQDITSAEILAKQIFNALTVFCKSGKYIALRISIYDLVSAPVPQYPVVLDYCKATMQIPAYKNAILQHRNIFHLGARFLDNEFLDLLFAFGYKYIPWTLNDDTELNEAVALHEPAEINYLLDHNVPIEYRTRNGVTPFGKAILDNSSQLMFQLFNRGASLSQQPIRGYSALDLAIIYNKTEPLILLLALGADISAEQVEKMIDVFGLTVAQKIMDRALALNKTMLKVPDYLDLDKDSGRTIVAFLQHKVLADKLGYPINQIKIKYKGMPLIGQQALQAITKYYASTSATDMFSFPEEVEIYKSLSNFDVDLFDFDGDDHLLKLLTQIAAAITSKPFKQYDDKDLIEIAKVVHELAELTHVKFSFDLRKLYITFKAIVAKHKIEFYLKRNGIKDINTSISQLNHPKGLIMSRLFFANERRAEYDELSFSSDIAPNLRI